MVPPQDLSAIDYPYFSFSKDSILVGPAAQAVLNASWHRFHHSLLPKDVVLTNGFAMLTRGSYGICNVCFEAVKTGTPSMSTLSITDFIRMPAEDLKKLLESPQWRALFQRGDLVSRARHVVFKHTNDSQIPHSVHDVATGIQIACGSTHQYFEAALAIVRDPEDLALTAIPRLAEKTFEAADSYALTATDSKGRMLTRATRKPFPPATNVRAVYICKGYNAKGSGTCTFTVELKRVSLRLRIGTVTFYRFNVSDDRHSCPGSESQPQQKEVAKESTNKEAPKAEDKETTKAGTDSPAKRPTARVVIDLSNDSDDELEPPQHAQPLQELSAESGTQAVKRARTASDPPLPATDKRVKAESPTVALAKGLGNSRAVQAKPEAAPRASTSKRTPLRVAGLRPSVKRFFELAGIEHKEDIQDSGLQEGDMFRFHDLVDTFCKEHEEFDAKLARAEFERIVERVVCSSWFA